VGPVLLYDGTCGLCAASVRFVLDHDAGGELRFATLDSAFGHAVRARHPELDDVDSVVWVERGDRGERVLTRSTAAIRVARYLGGWWRLAAFAWIVPRPIRDAIYRLIAKHRHRLTQSGPECLVPSAAERARFLG
jgi:predicted DCC family thiol-disulfide oxidoreductase YuxK